MTMETCLLLFSFHQVSYNVLELLNFRLRKLQSTFARHFHQETASTDVNVKLAEEKQLHSHSSFKMKLMFTQMFGEIKIFFGVNFKENYK
uniref:Uncharacterized protein n=1 Tax=Anguilla anguilla TaxID=7936 RepID=A0A0E9U9Y7_ANGAN